MNKKTLAVKKYFLTIALLINALLSFSQDNDWGLWTGIDIEKKLSKKWDLGIGGEYRLKDNMSATDQIRGSVDISRKLGDYVKLGAGYVFIADKKVKKDVFEYRNRFLLQATGSYKYARFTASWRTRMQLTLMETNEPRGNLFEDDSYNWVWRNRIQLKYDIRNFPVKPYMNMELFHHLFNNTAPGYYQDRLGAGIEYRLAKRHTIQTGYLLVTEIDNTSKYKNHIIKLGYTFSM